MREKEGIAGDVSLQVVLQPTRQPFSLTGILEEITTPTEPSELFNWALKGLHDLIDRGEFCNNPTSEELREKYIKASNPAQSFVEECLIYDSEATTSKDDFYQKYVEYCQKNKLPLV